MKLDKAEFNQLRYLNDKYKVKERELIEVLCNKLVKSYENIDDKFKGYGKALDEIYEKAKEFVEKGNRKYLLTFEIEFPKEPNLVRLVTTHYTDKGYYWPIGFTFKLDD